MYLLLSVRPIIQYWKQVLATELNKHWYIGLVFFFFLFVSEKQV